MKEYWSRLGKITFFRKISEVKRGVNSLCVQKNKGVLDNPLFCPLLVHFFFVRFFFGCILSAFLCDFLSEFFPDFLSDYLPNSLFNFLSDFFVQFHVSFLSGSPVLCLVLCLVLRLEIFQVEIRVPLSIFQKDSPDPGNSGQYLSCHLEF